MDRRKDARFPGALDQKLENGYGQNIENAPEQLTHGIYARHIDSIVKDGLVPGGKTRGTRHENHFATVEAWDHQKA